MQSRLAAELSRPAREAPPSGIVEVFDYGRDRPGLIPLWAGEGDLPTPDFIAEAAAKSLKDGETFYTWQRGIPELRQALVRYHQRHYPGSFDEDRFSVTGSGMQAIQIAIACVAGEGEEVLVPSPAWPNFPAAAGIARASVKTVPITLTQAGWRLDLERLAAAVTAKTRAIFVNSPGNPTGWTADRETLAAILDLARRHGLWIIADEVYHRFFFEGDRAASFHDVMEAEDRILFVNTFSKNWAMTGWRIGWIEAAPELGPTIANLIQYSTSGVAVFMQRAAVAALDEGEEFVAEQVARARAGRDAATSVLARSEVFRFSQPAGSFYLFFAIDRHSDTLKLGLRLVDEAKVGLAPGTAFGPGGERYMRLCFARRADEVEEAARRLLVWAETAGAT